MGRRSSHVKTRSSQKKCVAMLDNNNDDTDSKVADTEEEEVQVDMDAVLDEFVEALYEKKGSARGSREAALASLIKAFDNNNSHDDFLEKKLATLLSQCSKIIKKGSSKEVVLASQLLGLLSLNAGPGERAQQILDESLAPINYALKTCFETSQLLALLDCLAVVFFVGGEEAKETKKAMEIIWQVIDRKLGPIVTASAIYAWSFLVTTVDELKLTDKNWREWIFSLVIMLDEDDRPLRVAVGEALALIIEMGIEDKEAGVMEEAQIQVMMKRVFMQAKSLSIEAGLKGSSKKNLKDQRSTFKDLSEYLVEREPPQNSMRLCRGESLNTSTWSQLLRLNFLKRILGGGFKVQVLDNKFLHDVFDFTPGKDVRRRPSSRQKKARTKDLNWERSYTQELKIAQYSAAL